MQHPSKKDICAELSIGFHQTFREPVLKCEPLPPSGSYRQYFRLHGQSRSAIGVYNEDLKENRAFVSFAKTFFEGNLSVPQIYWEDPSGKLYLQQDLGDRNLFDFSREKLKQGESLDTLYPIYQHTLKELIRLQLYGGNHIDFSNCYPRDAFDRQSMMWDLNYFKYYFLKLIRVPFDEQLLENDFDRLVTFLLEADTSFFLFRDFQGRNIMLSDGQPVFIDFQGGRRGALHYDLASLLFDARADLPESFRRKMLEVYLDEMEKTKPIDRHAFKEHYYGYVLIRILQALGAFGFRGLIERKPHFIESTPYAVRHLEELLNAFADLPVEMPELLQSLYHITKSEYLWELIAQCRKEAAR